MAEELRAKKDLFIVFDELFRGTNVKDAYEATIAITSAFAKKRKSIFVISTHIIEAGDVLKEKYANINFVYLPTRMSAHQPVYTHIGTGITGDRHGMVIINNEKIPEILQNGNKQLRKLLHMGFKTDKQTLDDLNITGNLKHNPLFSSFNGYAE